MVFSKSKVWYLYEQVQVPVVVLVGIFRTAGTRESCRTILRGTCPRLLPVSCPSPLLVSCPLPLLVSCPLLLVAVIDKNSAGILSISAVAVFTRIGVLS